MRNTVDTSQGITKNRWFRLGCSITLASVLALILLFVPVKAGKVIRVPVPALPQSVTESFSLRPGGYSGKTIDLPLPFGAEIVRATGGLTITKIAPAFVNQGETLTYTLIITNHTGDDLTDALVTDTIPIGTITSTCTVANNPPSPPFPLWGGGCASSAVGWALVYAPPIFPIPLAHNTTNVLTFSVTVDQPLSNGSEVINSSYGISATGIGAFIDSGPVVTTTVNAPEWQISKSATPTPSVQAGDLLTYTLTVTNSGAFTTSGTFNVVDTIPVNTTFYTTTGSYVQTGTQAGDVITWTLSDLLGPGQATATTLVVRADSPLTNGLTITNTGYRVLGGNVTTGAVGPPVVSTVSSQAQLATSKAANASTVEAGDLITYTLTITNLASSNGHSEGVVITDPLPAELLFEGMGFTSPATGTTANPGSGNTGVVTWTLSNPILPGNLAQVYVVGRVISPLTNGTPLTNTCTVTAANALAPATCASLTNNVTSAPSLSLGKSVTPSTNVTPGGTVTYSLVISNTGNETATGVTVTDTLGPAFDPTSVILTNVTVPGRPTYGTVGTQTLVFTATAPLIPGTYHNTAITATYATTDVTAANLAPIVVGSPDLGIRKSVAPTSVIAGDTLTYTIVYSNASGAPATGVRVTDTLGANLTFVNASPAPNVLNPPEFGWDVGPLSQADGEQTITITASVASNTPNGVVVTNSVVITSAQGVGASDGPIDAAVLAPELQVVKSDAGYDPIDAGAVLTYTLTYSNTGDAAAHNVRITDTLDSNVSFAWASTSPAVSTPPVYVWTVGDLPATSSPQTLTVAVTVSQPLTRGTQLTNDVVIKGDEPFSDAASITTTVQSAPVFQVGKTASPSPVTPGQPLTYTIAFTNVGNATATGVRITDTLDSNVTLQSSNPISTGTVGNQVYWIWPSNVIPNDPQTIEVTVLVTSPLPNGTLLWNTTEVDSDQGATGTVSITTPVQSAAELHLTKTATPSVVQPGETIVYSIAYSNTGSAPVDVVITDTLDSNVNYVGASSPPSVSPPDYIWNVTGLSPLSGTQELTVTVTAGPVLADGTPLVNQVTIAGDGLVVSDTVTTTVQSVNLSVIKLADPAGNVQAGGWITYTISFFNTGGMDATGVLITDTLPVSLTNVVSSTSFGISFVGGPPSYVWSDNLVAGSSAEIGVITITGQLIQTPWPSTGVDLTNTVVISGDQAEAIISNNTFSTSNLGVPGDPYTVTVTPALTETTVGTNVSVTANATDQFGNPVQDNTAVNFTSQPVGSSVTPPSANTSGGVATTTLSSVVSATVTVTATAGTASGNADVIFRPGPLDHFAINVTSPQTAGITFTVVITALDQYNNVVDFDGTVTLTDTTGTLIPTGPPSLVDGQGAISVTIYTATSADVITATWGITTGASSPFVVLPGEPDTLTVTVDPAAIQVCQTALVTAAVTDQWGNPTPGEPVSLWVFDTPPVGGDATLSPAGGSTDLAGVFVSTLQATEAGNVIIYAESDLLDNSGSEPVANFSGPAVPTSLSLSVAPNPLYTGGATAVVTATVNDCTPTGLSEGQVVTFTLSDSSLAWFPGPSNTDTATTNASGEATATLTSNSTPTAGTLTITGTVAGLAPVVTTLNVELAPTPTLTITKTANPSGGNVRPGQTLNYTLVARNTGGAEATGVIISDTLPAGVGLVSRSTSGGTILSDTPLVVTGTLPAGEAITVTAQVTVTASVSGTVLNNQASVVSDHTSMVFSEIVSHQVITTTGGTVYLPIIVKNWDGTVPPTPTNANLRIININFVGGVAPGDGQKYHVYVVVSNVGTDTVNSDFWVDLYLNPVNPPPSVNQPWQTVSQSGQQGVSTCPSDPTCYGRAWFVTTDLAPGDVITLTTQMPADQRYDRWPAEGAPYASRHSPIMALVDSWGASYGAIYENNEGDNLSGSISGLGLTASEADLDLPIIYPWPSGSERPTLPAPQE